jgi:hypothetical protein
LLGITDRNLLFGRCAVHSLNDVGFDAHAVSAPNENKISPPLAGLSFSGLSTVFGTAASGWLQRLDDM